MSLGGGVCSVRWGVFWVGGGGGFHVGVGFRWGGGFISGRVSVGQVGREVQVLVRLVFLIACFSNKTLISEVFCIQFLHFF